MNIEKVTKSIGKKQTYYSKEETNSINYLKEEISELSLTYVSLLEELEEQGVRVYKDNVINERAEEAEAKLKEAADELEKINARLEHPIVDYSDECSERMSHLIKKLRDAE